MLLEVAINGGAWLADVGFGGDGLLLPIPLTGKAEVAHFHQVYRIAEEAGTLVLQTQSRGSWTDLYAFTREPQYPVDFEMANHFTSTYPTSIFVQTVTAQKRTTEERHILRNLDLFTEGPSGNGTRTLSGADELRLVLEQTFGLSLTLEETARVVQSITRPR
jgi:N-hydroxyarylamine O-acetyltransferase